MLASSSRISLKRAHTVLSASQRALQPSANRWQRRHASSLQEEFTPSPHLIASRDRIAGFSGDIDAQQALTRTTKARFNLQLTEEAELGHYSNVLEIAAKMKALKIQPDVTTYVALINAAAHHRMWLDAWAILDDMIAVGIQPNTAVFNLLIKACINKQMMFTHLTHIQSQAQNSCTSDYVWQVLRKMDELKVTPDSTTFQQIIVRFTSVDNMELAIQFYHAMKTYQVVPDILTMKALILNVAQAGYPRLALDLIADFEACSLRRLDHTFFMPCLIASAEALYLDGVITCWKQIVHVFNLHPGEGVCLGVLNTAARHGHPDLATDALRVLRSLNIDWEEHHFSPLIEAFCHQKQFMEAIRVLDIMRAEGIEPIPETASALLEALVSTEAIDTVWDIVDEITKEGGKIDVIVLQVLIDASIKLGDLQRAIGTYKSLAEYGATADVIIFNSLLRGCVAASHRDLGNLLLDDMKAAQVKPDDKTYETFIVLCLTQDDYEDAFFYLEEMKTAGFHPGYDVYAKIIRKCLSTDDFRYKIALKEMEEMGHVPRSDLKRLVRRKEEGTKPDDKSQQPVSGTSSQKESTSIDGAALRFIETGGTDGAAHLPREHV
ncbi:hypothetical protein C0993_004737 [Termitomyces sp. T159_Od127]|nr:hypothetical protein C0993_004737 [Termitomyces sp. T159_Od127]